LIRLAPARGLPYLAMKGLLVLLAHLLTTVAKLLGPGDVRAIVADSLLMRQQLLVINRSRHHAPNLSTLDRILFGFWSRRPHSRGDRRKIVSGTTGTRLVSMATVLPATLPIAGSCVIVNTPGTRYWATTWTAKMPIGANQLESNKSWWAGKKATATLPCNCRKESRWQTSPHRRSVICGSFPHTPSGDPVTGNPRK